MSAERLFERCAYHGLGGQLRRHRLCCRSADLAYAAHAVFLTACGYEEASHVVLRQIVESGCHQFLERVIIGDLFSFHYLPCDSHETFMIYIAHGACIACEGPLLFRPEASVDEVPERTVYITAYG